MSEDIIYTCPLGSVCEEIKDNKRHRCRWYIKLKGQDPQADKQIEEYRCAMEWKIIIGLEHSKFERQTGAAVESLRNVVAMRNLSKPKCEKVIEHKDKDDDK